jgi:hypothetical protein
VLSAEALAARFRAPEARKDGWWVFCPVHADGTKAGRRSQRIADGARGPLLKCWAGCESVTVLAAVGLTWRDVLGDDTPARSPRRGRPPERVVAEYDYPDETGTLQYQSVRMEPKRFFQRRPDPQRPGAWINNLDGVRLVLYRLDELVALRPQRVWLVEGEKDADVLWSRGLPATTSPMGAGKWRPEYAEQLASAGVAIVVLTPDNDPPGRSHMTTAGDACIARGLTCAWLPLDVPEKGDVTDWLGVPGNTVDAFLELSLSARPWPERTTLDDVHAIFTRWLPRLDLDVLDVVLAVAACERLDGDPPWLLIVGGSGDGKTETVCALEGAGALVVSTIASEGALLSATAAQSRAKDATGGLLRALGDRGTLVVKDVTSILSSNANMRAQVLAALREVYDGRWVRLVGVDGGRVLTWTGRLVVIGAVTTAWDTAHTAISAMGDRFLLVRSDSTRDRIEKARNARENIGREIQMRAELAAGARAILQGITTAALPAELVPEDDWRTLEDAADLVARCRTAVEADYRGEPIDAHAPEVPTRLLKQLGQVIRGARALGISIERAVALAHRVARDCIPPSRLAILCDLAKNPDSTASDIRRRLEKPRTTVVRLLEALHALHLVTCDEVAIVENKPWLNRYLYALAPGLNRAALMRMEPPPVETANPQREPGDESQPGGSRDVPAGQPETEGLPF